MKKKQRFGRILKLAILDVLLAGILLVTFAFFHHALPALRVSVVQKDSQVLAEPITDAKAPSSTETTPVPADPEPAVPEKDLAMESGNQQAEDAPEEIVEEVIDNRTEWQKKFEEHFSDEIIMTENSYKSPTVSIAIETVQFDFGSGQVTYHVADVYIASIENFTTCTANDRLVYFDTEDPMAMHERSGAILSMTGDFLTYQNSGFLIRNGETYHDDYTHCDICVLYPDGTMETHLKGEYNKDEINARNPLQVWNFGPSLLDENGCAKSKFNTSATVAQINPRTALGYYEPGHYCFVVVDGRQNGYSAGMYLDDLSVLFESLGCTAAYNMDGGGSALMMFGDSRYSQMSNGADRALGDIILIREAEVVE